LRLEV